MYGLVESQASTWRFEGSTPHDQRRSASDITILDQTKALFRRALASLKIALAPASLKDELLCRSRVFF
jgi:hypothetical protein